MVKTPSAKTTAANTREDRLKAALKANLSRRKEQMRARAADDKPDTRLARGQPEDS